MKRLLVCYPGWLSAGGLLLGVALIAMKLLPLTVIGVALIVCAYAVPFARLWIRK